LFLHNDPAFSQSCPSADARRLTRKSECGETFRGKMAEFLSNAGMVLPGWLPARFPVGICGLAASVA
jgi:hypothetical protein